MWVKLGLCSVMLLAITFHIKIQYERNPIFNETNDYVARMSGFIVAPYDGEFQFYVSSSDKVSLYISSSTDVNDTQLIAKSNKANIQVGLSRNKFRVSLILNTSVLILDKYLCLFIIISFAM